MVIPTLRRVVTAIELPHAIVSTSRNLAEQIDHLKLCDTLPEIFPGITHDKQARFHLPPMQLLGVRHSLAKAKPSETLFFRTYLSTTPVELLTTSSLNETDNSLGRHFRIVVSAVDGQTAYPLPTFYIPSETHLCHSADAFYESDPTCVLPLYANDDAPHILAGAINTLSDRMSPIQ